eukprot:gene8907-1597_t
MAFVAYLLYNVSGGRHGALSRQFISTAVMWVVTTAGAGLAGLLSMSARSLSWGISGLAGVMSMAVPALLIWSAHAQASFYSGVLVHDHWPACALPYTPWRALLPRGTFNFFTGSQSCPDPPFSAHLNSDTHFLSVHCPEGTASLIRNPDHVSAWSNNPFQEPIWVYLQARERASVHPEIVPLNVTPVKVTDEYFDVQCGVHRQLPLQSFFQAVRNDQTVAVAKARCSTRRPNIVILMLDAVSRQHFRRRLTNTRNWILERASQNANWSVYEYPGYNIVGGSTLPNLTPLLFGKALPKASAGPAAELYKRALWRWLGENGYTNLWMQGGCFNYMDGFWGLRTGPDNLTEDLAQYTLCNTSRDSPPISASHLCNGGSGGPGAGFDKEFVVPRGCHPDYDSPRGLQYNLDFPEDVPSFSFAHFYEGHEGSLEVLDTMDNSLAQHLDWMHTPGVVDTSLVLLMADHGNHMGPYFELTAAGKAEARSPVLFAFVPPLLSGNAKWAKANQRRMVTAFDLYRTLRQVGTCNRSSGMDSVLDPP